MERVIYVVLDGVGIGALPDADAYGDGDADTLGNLSRLLALRLPNLGALGLGNIAPLRGVPPVAQPRALTGLLAERSPGKDSTSGHFEHMGLVLSHPFPTYPQGFPPQILEPLERVIGRQVLGNKPASGTEILEELGEEHLRTGCPILYTSQDSVLQLAAHESVVPPPVLYEWCLQIRKVLDGPETVARVIARPFTGSPGSFIRSQGRRDFSLPPPGPTYLDLLREEGIEVTGVGKVGDLFTECGFSQLIRTRENAHGLAVTKDLVRERCRGLVFVNLGDFDTKWGHRNDAEGFREALSELDRGVGELLSLLGPGDALLITADHGCDPTTSSTDHSREFVPLLFYAGPGSPAPGLRCGWFSDGGATAWALLTGKAPPLAGRDLRKVAPTPGARPARSEGRAGRAPAVRDAAGVLRRALGVAPPAAVVLGSGLDGVVEQIEPVLELSYHDIPGWPCPTVRGHAGAIVVGQLGPRRVAFLRGRAHLYEGFSREAVGFPVRSLRAWGVDGVLLTCAAGALADHLPPGSLVEVVTILDFQRLEHMSRRGLPRVLRVGPEGDGCVYAAVMGPHYETPLEARVLRNCGADIVGMSCAAEVAAAQQVGLPCRVFALVTNRAGAPVEGDVDLHEAVLARARASTEALRRLITGAWPILTR